MLYGLWVILPYSICANWLWAGGWLAQEGLNWGLGHGAVDFAGSGVVYAVGGIIALAGCVVIGPRVGRRPGDVPKTSHEYDLRAVVIGTAILIVPWGGIPPGTAITLIVVNTAWSTFTGALRVALFLKLAGCPSTPRRFAKVCLPAWWRSPRPAPLSTPSARRSSAPSAECFAC